MNTLLLRRIPLLADALVVGGFSAALISILQPTFLNSPNLPTGGDTASHVLYAWLYAHELLFSGKITAWVPEVFGGLPFLSYYFPLPFVVIALLAKVLPFAVAFKWGTLSPVIILPGVVYLAGKYWLRLPWPSAFFGAMGALAFVLHEGNSIWGGNLLSTLAGEFAYSYGMMLSFLAMLAWARGIQTGGGWLLAGTLEAATGFAHGYALLVTAMSTGFFLFDDHPRRNLWFLARGHAFAFCLLGGWLWPLLEMRGLTIPNDGPFPIKHWQELLPPALWPVAGTGLVGLLCLGFPAFRQQLTTAQLRTVAYFIGTAALAAMGWLAADRVGLADIRFFPYVWLLGAIACGWLGGLLFCHPFWGRNRFAFWARPMFLLAGTFLMAGWLSQQVQVAPDWSLWNNSGYEAKPQWQNLTRIFPAITGNPASPRLLFEHDPDNNDLGSTRALEALPMFLNGRPVLEGLYMESAALAPAVYQLQSEVSARPSSPLVRFPSGQLDAQAAAEHMRLLYSNEVLLRSRAAKSAIEQSGLFVKTAEAPPFTVYRLKDFDSPLISVVTMPLRKVNPDDWMTDAFIWFKSVTLRNAYLPVYTRRELAFRPAPASPLPAISAVRLARDALSFRTTAVGSPHLIKMAYHPRWRLRTKGRLYLAAPGFLLVVPDEPDVRLEYGTTPIGWAGLVASCLAVAAMLFVVYRGLRRARSGNNTQAPRDKPTIWPKAVWFFLLACTGVWSYAGSPERLYNQAWKAMTAQRYEQAANDFLLAYQGRKVSAKKEEALFWAAKANERANRRAEAEKYYKQLADNYHGYWVPESLYAYARLERLDGNIAEADRYRTRLEREYPASPWARRVGGL